MNKDTRITLWEYFKQTCKLCDSSFRWVILEQTENYQLYQVLPQTGNDFSFLVCMTTRGPVWTEMGPCRQRTWPGVLNGSNLIVSLAKSLVLVKPFLLTMVLVKPNRVRHKMKVV